MRYPSVMSGDTSSPGAHDFTAVIQQVQRWVDAGYYPGAGLAIGRGGHVVLERHFGAYTPETEEYIASAGKWLAAATIAVVVDRGLLSWDDRVGQWLPELVEASDIRLRQLLSHTSGLAAQQPPERARDDHQTLAESVAHIATLPLLEPPGTRFRYGGLALQVAGRMAELAAEQSFDELFRCCLARPLGLEHTRFTPVDPAPGHNPKLGGGARSNARDYLRFLSMLAARGVFAGERVLSSAAVDEMERDQVGVARLEPGEFVDAVRGATHTGVYGLGAWRERLDRSGQATQLSSPSWAGTYPWLDRERELYGVLVAHVDLGGPAGAGGFNAFHSSAIVADLAAAAVDATDR
jgi:CubicO group peptidase (beta-lactamase class C family)